MTSEDKDKPMIDSEDPRQTVDQVMTKNKTNVEIRLNGAGPIHEITVKTIDGSIQTIVITHQEYQEIAKDRHLPMIIVGNYMFPSLAILYLKNKELKGAANEEARLNTVQRLYRILGPLHNLSHDEIGTQIGRLINDLEDGMVKNE